MPWYGINLYEVGITDETLKIVTVRSFDEATYDELG